MKKIISVIAFCFLGFSGFAQELSVSYTDATTAVNNLVGSSGITVSGATFNGASSQIGLVSNSSGIIGFTSGVILTTGNASFAQTGNTSNVGDDLPVTSSTSPDPDLQLLLGSGSQKSPMIFEFDFTTTGAHPSFEYIFLSEEYNNYAPSTFHDGFGFFISGPGISGPYSGGAINIATVPSTTLPVSVNTINYCTNSTYYRNNCRYSSSGSGTCISQQSGNSSCMATSLSLNNHSIPYNGLTSVLQAKATLDCNLLTGATYHCKIVIANINDDNYDSAIILKTGSLKSDFVVSPITAFPQPLCEGQPLTLSVTGNSSYNYSWSTGQNGIGLTSINSPAASASNPYSVTVTNSDGCQITQSINAIVHDPINVAPYDNGINSSGNYVFYAQAGIYSCFTFPTFDTPTENVTFQLPISGLPFGASFAPITTGQQVGQFCWTPPSSAIGDYTFTVNYSDNNACGQLAGSATFTVRIGCGSCVPNKYYENRQPSSNPLPSFTKAGYGIYAGQSVDPLQTDGPVDVGTATVEFKAGVEIVLSPGFTGGPGFTATIDPNTCITDCEDCCSHFPGLTYDFIPNVFTPNGDGTNDIWYVPDHNYPFCAYNAQYFKLEVYNEWGGMVYNNEIYSPTCCPFRSKVNASDPTIPSINWNGIANHDVNYNWLEQLLGYVEAHNGSRVSDGTYYYILNLSGCSVSQNFTGFITVLGGGHSMIVPAPIPETASETAEDPRSFASGSSENVSVPELITFPNPTSNNLTVVMSDNTLAEGSFNISVFNYLGQSVSEYSYIINQVNKMDVSNLRNGIYTIRVSYQNKDYFKTFIKSE